MIRSPCHNVVLTPTGPPLSQFQPLVKGGPTSYQNCEVLAIAGLQTFLLPA